MVRIPDRFRLASRLWRNERGGVLVYTTLMAGVMIGIGVLAIDVGRLTTLHTQVQAAADAAALAGARELDLLPDSHARAKAAVAQALSNFKDFSTDEEREIAVSTTLCAGDVTTNCIRFLDSLPASDRTVVDATYETNDPTQTSFIEVRVGQSGFAAMFAGVVGDVTTGQTSARAIAGNDSLVCAVPPMFMCSLDPATSLEGKQVRLLLQGTGFAPGNFGLLCPSGTEGQTNCGGSSISSNLASTAGSCIRRRGVQTKPGVTLQMVRTGMNARFDWWLPQAKDDAGDWRTQDKYKPAVNVTQGRAPQGNPASGGTKCDRDQLDPTEARALPRDPCMDTDTCAAVSGYEYVGGGGWDSAEYFRINHGGDGTTAFRPVGWPAGAPVTRYNVYRYEIEKNYIVQPGQAINASATQPAATTTENGNPECFQGTAPTNDYTYLDDFKRDLELLKDRRILPIAVLDCGAMAGKTTIMPEGFAFVFLTEPMGSPSESALYAEYLGELDGEAQQSLQREVVQIYRR